MIAMALSRSAVSHELVAATAPQPGSAADRICVRAIAASPVQP